MADNYPIYKQLDSMDCGAVCLRMIAAYHGANYSLEQIRGQMHLDKDGVSLLNISDTAKTIGLDSLGVKVNFDKLKAGELPLPAIVHWGQNHFVVVYEISDKEVIIADPAECKRILSHADFISNWTSDSKKEGIVLLLETMEDFELSEQPAIPTEATIANKNALWVYLARSPKLWIQIGFGSLLIAGLYFLIPFFLKEIIDSSFPELDSSFLKIGLTGFFILGFSIILLELIRNYLSLYIGAKTNLQLVSNYLFRLTSQPIRYFETKLKWDLLQRIYDNIQVGEFLQSSSVKAIFYLLNLIVFTLVLLIFKVQLGVIFLFGLLLQFVWIFLFQFKRTASRNRMFEFAANGQDLLLELISGISEIKLHNAEEINRAAWESNQIKLFEHRYAFNKIDQIQKVGTKLIQLLIECSLIYFAASYFLEHKISLGTVLAVVYILGQLKTPLLELFDFILKYQDIKLGLERLSEMKIEASFKHEKIESKQVINKDIKLRNLSFSYGEDTAPLVLDKLNFSIPKNKTTAIVGVSGSGKTTLMKLLLGLYKATEGDILIGDKSLSQINPATWRKNIGTVFQDSYLFSNTIAKNICMSNTEVDQFKLNKTLKIACLDQFVSSLPIGVDTLIGEDGIRLSKGQEQLILIARMIYKNPHYFFMDEATSNLDAVTERKLMINLEKYFESKTLVIVAQKMTTVKKADHIIVMHKGRFIEEGTHENLLFKKGAYYLFLKNEIEN